MAGLMSSGGLKKTLKYVDIGDTRLLESPGYPGLSPTYYVNVRSKLPPEIYQKLKKSNICTLSNFAYTCRYPTSGNYVIIYIIDYHPSSGQIDFNVQATYPGQVEGITFRVYYID